MKFTLFARTGSQLLIPQRGVHRIISRLNSLPHPDQQNPDYLHVVGCCRCLAQYLALAASTPSLSISLIWRTIVLTITLSLFHFLISVDFHAKFCASLDQRVRFFKNEIKNSLTAMTPPMSHYVDENKDEPTRKKPENRTNGTHGEAICRQTLDTCFEN